MLKNRYLRDVSSTGSAFKMLYIHIHGNCPLNETNFPFKIASKNTLQCK